MLPVISRARAIVRWHHGLLMVLVMPSVPPGRGSGRVRFSSRLSTEAPHVVRPCLRLLAPLGPARWTASSRSGNPGASATLVVAEEPCLVRAKSLQRHKTVVFPVNSSPRTSRAMRPRTVPGTARFHSGAGGHLVPSNVAMVVSRRGSEPLCMPRLVMETSVLLWRRSNHAKLTLALHRVKCPAGPSGLLVMLSVVWVPRVASAQLTS